VKVAAELKAAVPALDIRVDEKAQSATVYSGASNFYLSGRMSSDGMVTLDRLGSVSAATFRKIVAVLEADKPRGNNR